jgi:hypothetical protein
MIDMRDNTIKITNKQTETDLWYIQKLFDHKSSKTTEFYTHVSNKSLSSITSPLDNLNKGVNIGDKRHP